MKLESARVKRTTVHISYRTALDRPGPPRSDPNRPLWAHMYLKLRVTLPAPCHRFRSLCKDYPRATRRRRSAFVLVELQHIVGPSVGPRAAEVVILEEAGRRLSDTGGDPADCPAVWRRPTHEDDHANHGVVKPCRLFATIRPSTGRLAAPT